MELLEKLPEFDRDPAVVVWQEIGNSAIIGFKEADIFQI